MGICRAGSRPAGGFVSAAGAQAAERGSVERNGTVGMLHQTGPDGDYLFGQLCPGSYTVEVDGATVHVDAVQAVGKLPIDLSRSAIDLLTLSGHKLHAPKGVGALYVRKGFRFRPFLLGGHQERGRRAGTQNVASIVALGKAAELAEQDLQTPSQEAELRDLLQRELLAAIPDCEVNGGNSPRLPNTTNIGFKYIEGEAILYMLNREGICASSGSACTSGSLDPSHVLMSMGLPYTILHGSIRFSLSRFTTEAEIQHVLAVMPGIVDRLRALSPFNTDQADWLQERDVAIVR